MTAVFNGISTELEDGTVVATEKRVRGCRRVLRASLAQPFLGETPSLAQACRRLPLQCHGTWLITFRFHALSLHCCISSSGF